MRPISVMLAFAIVVAIGCNSTATEAEACAAAVMLEGVLYYSEAPQASPPAGVDLREPFTEVTLFDPSCDDTINSPGSGAEFSMENGESNFLRRGTAVYRIDGSSASERLAAQSDAGWVVLASVDR